MFTTIMLIIAALLIYTFYRMISNSRVTADENGFSQAGVSVNYKTQKITIREKTYYVNEVQGIEYVRNSKFGTEVKIKVDDFKKPIHKIGIMGIGNEGEKFIQRLEAALRKAGGPSFY